MVAVNVTEAPEADGLVPAVCAMLMVGTIDAFTLIVILLLVAKALVAHDELDVITHDTTEPAVNVVVVNAALFVPAFTPFTFHW